MFRLIIRLPSDCNLSQQLSASQRQPWGFGGSVAALHYANVHQIKAVAEHVARSPAPPLHSVRTRSQSKLARQIISEGKAGHCYLWSPFSAKHISLQVHRGLLKTLPYESELIRSFASLPPNATDFKDVPAAWDDLVSVCRLTNGGQRKASECWDYSAHQCMVHHVVSKVNCLSSNWNSIRELEALPSCIFNSAVLVHRCVCHIHRVW